MEHLIEKLDEAKSFILAKTGTKPFAAGIILGSGLGGLADRLEDAVALPYRDIPHFPVSTVPGHKGLLVAGTLEEKRVLCMQGRFHYYEGWSMDQIVFPVQVMHLLGIKNLILTNAAGCVNTSWEPGDLMVISDHIKLVADSPLRGPNCDELGERFFDMCSAYDPELRKLALKCGKEAGIELHEGIYMLFTGPSFETPAEVRFARICGADAVGMSTVPEAIAASQMKMHTLGISCLTNMAAGITAAPLNHKEVLETGERAKTKFETLVRMVVKNI